MVAYAPCVPAFGHLLSKERFCAQARGHIRCTSSYGCLRNDDLRSLGRVVEGLDGCANRAVVRNRCCRHNLCDGICTEKLKSVVVAKWMRSAWKLGTLVHVRLKIM